MSKTVENILYVGNNIQLVQVMLNLPGVVSGGASYRLHHVSNVAEIEAALAEINYAQFICEMPLSKYLADKIAIDFPLLKIIYLTPQDTPKAAELSAAMEGLLTDEVKKTLDYLSIPIYFKNRNGQFLACNRYFSKLFGKSPAQVIGKMAAAVLPAHVIDEIEKIDQEVFDSQQVYFYECQILDLKGRERDIVFRKESVANGTIQIGMIFDVTEMNEAKSLLEKERIMLRATADISKDLIFFKDLESRFLGCNKEFEKFVGSTEQDILGKKDDQLFELEQARMCQAQDQEVMVKNKIYVGEEYLTYNNGERHFIEMRKVPLRGKDGKVQGLIGVGRDITVRHIVQKQLKIAEVVFENSNDSILVTDELGNIISANKACCATTGFSKKELLRLNVSVLSSAQHAPTFYQQMQISLKENKSWQGDITYRIKNGEIRFAWLEIYVVEHAEEGISNRIYSFTDLNQNKKIEEKIQFLSKHDPLTGVFNRIALFTRLEDAISRASHKELTMAVILVDINGFKEINDQYGHNAGDAVLKEIATRLKSCVFGKDTVARFGDDEFVIIVDELDNEQDVAVVAQKIAAQFDRIFVIEGFSAYLSATIGISISPDDGTDIDSLIGNAEKAMQRGKQDKSAPYHFYTMELTRHSNQQFELEEELKQALQQDQFELYYRPQYDLNKRQTVAVESLLRWNHPQRGLQNIECFLTLAENSGLVVPMGLQMIRKAAMQAVTWQKSAINFGRIAISLSETQLSQLSFIADLQTILLETKCSSRWLEFSVEEVIFASASAIVYENLVNIHKLGIALTVDNFAAERPILYLFEQLGIEKFKIAKHYTDGFSAYFVGEAIKNAVAVLARSLGVDVVGESLDNMTETVISSANRFDSQGKRLKNKAMKASEITFYLRCNKRK